MNKTQLIYSRGWRKANQEKVYPVLDDHFVTGQTEREKTQVFEDSRGCDNK